MKIHLLAGLMFALAGCASADINEAPKFEGKTAKSVDTLVQCVSDAWSVYMPVNQISKPQGVQLIIPGQDGPVSIATFIGDKGHTRYTYHQASNFGRVPIKLRDSFQSCVDG